MTHFRNCRICNNDFRTEKQFSYVCNECREKIKDESTKKRKDNTWTWITKKNDRTNKRTKD